MAWFRRSDGSFKAGEEQHGEVEFDPAKFKGEITTEITGKFGEYQTKNDEKLAPVLEFITSFKADQESRAAAARKIAEDKAKGDNQLTEEDYLLDPIEATRRAMEPTNIAVRLLASRQARREVLEDKEYYHGELKTKVDAMIDQQPLNLRHDPNVITNCYKLVMYDNDADIKAGKIKARNTGAIFESGGTGGHSGKEGGEGEESWSKEEETAAGHMGLTKKDWIASRKELTYV